MAQIPETQMFAMEDKEANVEKLKKEIVQKSLLAREEVEPLNNQERELTTFIINETPNYLRRLDHRFWNNSRPVTHAGDIRSRHYIAPRQRGPLSEGVKWGIAYTDGQGFHDPTARKWIVAFDTAAKKAYVEAGPMGPIDWNVIEVKLGLSTNKVEYVDDILGGGAKAKIEGVGSFADALFF